MSDDASMITRRASDLMRFIAGYQEKHGGISPSFSECSDALDFKTKSVVLRHMLALERRGIIRRLHDRARAIEILRNVTIPRAPDGEPLFFVRVG